MEIKCKVSFTLPEELVDALELTDDTPIIASVSGNRITLEFADDEFEDTEDDLCDEDEEDYDEHDLDDEDDCDEDDYDAIWRELPLIQVRCNSFFSAILL